MLLGRLTLDLIVHESGDIVLQVGSQLIDNGLVGTLRKVSVQLHVGFKDLLVSIGQVILTSVCARHCDAGTNWRRGHRQILDDHIFWAGNFRSEPEKDAIFS